jgi:hypothetical protein
MTITKYTEHLDLADAMAKGEPFLAVISLDGEQAYLAHSDEVMQHHILLSKVGLPSDDIDNYFRISFDRHSADWTFICPPNYKNLADRSSRIAEFYKDGFAAISRFLAESGLLVDIKILKRFRRHTDAM